MANNKSDKPTVEQEEKVATPAQKAPSTAKYSKAVLVAQAAQLDATPELMAGALASVKADTLTRQEAKDALKAYLSRPVHPKKGSEK